VKTLAVYGGVSINPQDGQKSSLEQDILIATPGDYLDLLSQNASQL